jgi:hypothetical protein
MSRYRRDILVSLVLVAATVAIYWPVRDNGFVNFDDNIYITQNRGVHSGLSTEGLLWAFTTTAASNWHPLTWLSLQLDYQLSGLDPRGFHRTNVLLHVANTLLLFGLLRRMTGALWRSALVAALFAWHPLHVESVAWASERKDVLSTLFWMLTLWGYLLYVSQPAAWRYLVVVLAFALGLLAKPMLVTLPCVLMLLDYWPLRRFLAQACADPDVPHSRPPAVSLGRLVAEKVPLLALAAASCAVTIYVQQRGGALGTLKHFPLPVRAGSAVVAYTGYIIKMVWPLHLAPFYPHPRQTPPVWQVATAGLLLIGVTAAALWQGRRRPYLLVGWLWYLGTLVPVLGLVQVGLQAMADRYTYVPLTGLFLIVSWGLGELAARSSEWARASWLVASLALAACMILSVNQVRRWHDSQTLWEHALRVTTGNYMAHTNLAAELQHDPARLSEAMDHYNQALTANPRFYPALNGRGVLFARLGDSANARSDFAAALEIAPQDARAHYNMAVILATQPGKSAEAVLHLTMAIELAEAMEDHALAERLRSQLRAFQNGELPSQKDEGRAP